MSVFAASDIVQFAIRIEENGMNFYRYAVQLVKDEEAKNLFSRLADDEAGHKRFFEKLFAGMEKETPPPEEYAGEYDVYLREYVDNNIIFTAEVMEKELQGIKDRNSAIDFALRREMDSIFYYSEVKRFVPPARHGDIDKVIDEERRHVAILSAAKKC